ncbi:hypothetical protein SAMN04487898_10895 [Pedobacter sp. ok626]|nr:hypothetical protein SAMN04487898_10895 [Pedobacter sp. ok626]
MWKPAYLKMDYSSLTEFGIIMLGALINYTFDFLNNETISPKAMITSMIF